jgi:saccharopine dehydrogenase (NAD+, L-lysine-forming)
VRVALLGAGGTIAPAIVHDLATSDEAEEILLLDIDAERAAAVAAEHGAGKAKAERADARAAAGEPGALEDFLEGIDVLVNSASYRVNLEAMRASLAAGCHYMDLGGLYYVAEEQFELDREFAAAGLLALLGIGSAPGKTNLMGAIASRRLGGSLDRADVAAAGQDLDPPDGFSVPYALRTLIDELTIAPVVVRDGEVTEVEPLADGGTVDFGDPLGERETIYTLHTETLTFPRSFGCAEASFRLSLAPELLKRLKELAAAGDEEIDAAAHDALPPSPKTVGVHVVDATAGERSIRVKAVTRPHEEWGLGGGIVSTASPVAAAVRLLARGRIEARGVHPPETSIDPGEMFAELAQRVGTEVDIQEGVAA